MHVPQAAHLQHLLQYVAPDCMAISVSAGLREALGPEATFQVAAMPAMHGHQAILQIEWIYPYDHSDSFEALRATVGLLQGLRSF